MISLVSDIRCLTFEKKEGFEERVRQRLVQYVESGNEEWKKYVNWNKHKYTRNLVEINPEFEMIVLCWDHDQESPIHNHSSQDCWYAVVEGSVEEIYYAQKEDGSVVKTETHTHKMGDVGHIIDDIALHVVRPTKGNRAVTIHIYSKPIPECNVYCAKTGLVTPHVSGFFTIFGKKACVGDSNVYRRIYADIVRDSAWKSRHCDKSTYLHYFDRHISECK